MNRPCWLTFCCKTKVVFPFLGSARIHLLRDPPHVRHPALIGKRRTDARKGREAHNWSVKDTRFHWGHVVGVGPVPFVTVSPLPVCVFGVRVSSPAPPFQARRVKSQVYGHVLLVRDNCDPAVVVVLFSCATALEIYGTNGLHTLYSSLLLCNTWRPLKLIKSSLITKLYKFRLIVVSWVVLWERNR